MSAAMCSLLVQVHIQKVLEMGPVQNRWIATHGKPPTDDDVERMYQNFVPLLCEVLKDHSEMIEGGATLATNGARN